MPFATGQGGPALPVDVDGVPMGTALNPFVVSGAPAGAATIVDGGDVCEGAIADAAATAGSTGTISAKLRRATAQLVALGAVGDAAETNPASSASLVAVLKGILTVQAAILTILQDVHDGTAHTLKTTVVT
jgi:hypothetical protein